FLLPVIFIVLWSSAFVAGKAGVHHSTPFAFLAARFIIVALIFSGVAAGLYMWHRWHGRTKSSDAVAPHIKTASSEPILLTALVGLLLHGFYLGSTFLAMSLGLGLYVIPLAIIRHPELTDLANAPVAAILTALQIGIGLALLGRGLIAPHGAALRAAFGAAGLAVIFLRFTG
ncbi:MAG: hypothetical protein EBT94_13075, partial [Alphaproteobacteria bacterium]|nr:hypothetical protein [Alphaproteobacteria bacterium]